MSQPRLCLSFDVHPAGPRPRPRKEPLFLAFKIACAYERSPPAPSRDDIKALLPWNLLQEETLKFWLIGFYPNGHKDRLGEIDVQPPPRQPRNEPFFKRLRHEIETRAVSLIDKMDLGWGRGSGTPGSHVEQGDEEDGSSLKKWPWLGFSSGLAAMQASLSRDLRARWLLEVKGETFKRLDNAIHEAPTFWLIAVPSTIRDNRTGRNFQFQDATLATTGGIETAVVHYSERGDERLIAYARPVPGAFLRGKEVPSEFQHYWLAVGDSRADSLADVDQVILSNASPRNLAALLGPRDLESILEVVSAGGPAPPLPPTLAQLDAFTAAVQRAILGANDTLEARQFLRATLAPLGKADNQAVADAMTDQAALWWEKLVSGINGASADQQSSADQYSLKAALLKTRLAARIEPLFHVGRPERPVLPGEGIDFLVGEAKERIIGEQSTKPNQHNYRNELAEFGILVRRRSGALHGPSDGWRLVTAGVPIVDPEQRLVDHPWGSPPTNNQDELPFLKEIVPRGIALAFKDGVLRNDDCYKGQLMIGPNALASVNARYRRPGQDGESINKGPLEFVSPGPVRTEVDGAEFGLAPPLRYGDHYDLCAFIIDRAGGIPLEISRSDDPTALDFSKLARLVPSPSRPIRPIHFLRRVPIGDLNIVPPESGSWPPVPSGVKLRAREWLDGTDNPWKPKNAIASEDAPAILLNDTSGTDPRFKRSSFSFLVEPPQIDEFTLQRWALPGRDESAAGARIKIDALKAELVRIIRDRPAEAGKKLPHDPCVFGLAYETRVFGPDGQEVGTLGRRDAKAFRAAPEAFRKHPIEIFCGIATPPGQPKDNQIILPGLPPGHFAILRLWLLVSKSDHERLDNDVLRYRSLNDVVCEGTPCLKHPSATIVFETATSAMPKTVELYNGFSLKTDAAQNVVARFDDASIANLQFVDQFEIARQRWVWRNLANVTADPARADDEERLLSSGLPLDLAHPDQSVRDDSRQMFEFDARAELDSGFVMRPLAEGRWPRTKGGLIAHRTELLVDNRDGQTAADYLRYTLKVISRYSSLFEHGLAVAATPFPHADQSVDKVRGNWRRVAARYRGTSELRPLNILAVLPLTSQPKLDPFGREASRDTEASTPFLVLFDEIWFREYGPGETLRAEVALEEREIGETDQTARPARLGPLPTKHLTRRKDPKQWQWTDETAAAARELRLRCYGPYGYSLDRTGNEALANASAFVVFVPDTVWRVGPYWGLFVRFRRVLHGLSSAAGRLTIEGPPSGAYPLYTLAGSEQLAFQVDATNPHLPTARIRQENGALRILSDELDFRLVPYFRDGARAPEPVQGQYRYLLLLGREGLDGGRGAEVFLPEHGYWIDSDRSVKEMGDGMPQPDKSWSRGQILEIEMSSPHYAKGGSKIETARSLKELFREMLPDPEPASMRHVNDAAGRITRVSAIFALHSEL